MWVRKGHQGLGESVIQADRNASTVWKPLHHWSEQDGRNTSRLPPWPYRSHRPLLLTHHGLEPVLCPTHQKGVLLLPHQQRLPHPARGLKRTLDVRINRLSTISSALALCLNYSVFSSCSIPDLPEICQEMPSFGIGSWATRILSIGGFTTSGRVLHLLRISYKCLEYLWLLKL